MPTQVSGFSRQWNTPNCTICPLSPKLAFTKMTYKTPEKRFTPSACKPTRPQTNISMSGGTDYVAYPSSNPTFRKTTMSFINTKDFKKEQPIYNRKTSHHNLLCLPLVISIVVTLFFLWMNHFFYFLLLFVLSPRPEWFWPYVSSPLTLSGYCIGKDW